MTTKQEELGKDWELTDEEIKDACQTAVSSSILVFEYEEIYKEARAIAEAQTWKLVEWLDLQMLADTREEGEYRILLPQDWEALKGRQKNA